MANKTNHDSAASGHTAPVMSHSRTDLAARIDYTLLSPTATTWELERLCKQAVEHGFATVCVNPTAVAFCSSLLGGTSVRTCAAVGFPTGCHSTAVKTAEAEQCVRDGAREIDVVANVGWLKGGDVSDYRADLFAVRSAAGSDTILKVIIEASVLCDEEIVRAAQVCADIGADFVKTSTGVYGNARVDDIRLLRRVLPGHIKIKAAGGIRTAAGLLAMIEAGAVRIGASQAIEIIKAL